MIGVSRDNRSILAAWLLCWRLKPRDKVLPKAFNLKILSANSTAYSVHGIRNRAETNAHSLTITSSSFPGLNMSHFGRGLNIRFREHIKRLFTSRRLVGDSNSVTTSKTKAGAFKNLGARPKSSIRKSSSTDTTINSDFVSTRRQECPQSTQLSKRPSTRTRNSEYSLPYSERLGLRSKCDSFSKPSEVGDVKRSQTIGSVDGPMRRLSSSSECLVPSFASQNWSRRSYHSDKTCSYVESSYSDFGPGSRKSTGRARRIDGLNRGFHHRYGSNKQTNSYENVCLPQRSRQKQNLRHPGISENDINRPPLSTVASGQQPLNPRKKKSSGTYEKGQPNYQLQRKEPANVIVAKMTRGGELRKIRASVSQIRYRDNASRSHKQPGDQWNDCTTSIEAPQRTSQMRGSKPGTRFPTKSMRFGYKSCRNGHGTSVEYMQTQNSSRGDLEPNLVQRISAACKCIHFEKKFYKCCYFFGVRIVIVPQVCTSSRLDRK